MRWFIAVAAVMLPLASHAAIPMDCKKAINLNKPEEVQRLANELLTRVENYEYSDFMADIGEECILEATGNVYEYDAASRTFKHDEKATEGRNAELAAEVERQKAEAEAEKEWQRQMQEMRKEAAIREEQQKQDVYERMVSGCENMYRRAPDETITNKMCFDVFLVTGLPED